MITTSFDNAPFTPLDDPLELDIYTWLWVCETSDSTEFDQDREMLETARDWLAKRRGKTCGLLKAQAWID